MGPDWKLKKNMSQPTGALWRMEARIEGGEGGERNREVITPKGNLAPLKAV